MTKSRKIFVNPPVTGLFRDVTTERLVDAVTHTAVLVGVPAEAVQRDMSAFAA